MGVSAAQKFGQGSYGHGIPQPGQQKILIFSVSMTFLPGIACFNAIGGAPENVKLFFLLFFPAM
jgi:hypothetical protein